MKVRVQFDCHQYNNILYKRDEIENRSACCIIIVVVLRNLTTKCKLSTCLYVYTENCVCFTIILLLLFGLTFLLFQRCNILSYFLKQAAPKWNHFSMRRGIYSPTNFPLNLLKWWFNVSYLCSLTTFTICLYRALSHVCVRLLFTHISYTHIAHAWDALPIICSMCLIRLFFFLYFHFVHSEWKQIFNNFQQHLLLLYVPLMICEALLWKMLCINMHWEGPRNVKIETKKKYVN